MRTHYLFFLLLAICLRAVPAGAQGAQNFSANIVKVAGTKEIPHYGFITGTNAGVAKGQSPELYFVLISAERQFLEDRPRLKVLVYGRGRKKYEMAQAEQLTAAGYPTVGRYHLALYKVAHAAELRKNPYQEINPTELENYHLFWDSAADDDELEPYYDFQDKMRDKHEINELAGQTKPALVKEPVQFRVKELGQRDNLAQAGMPLLNGDGNVVGVIAQNQPEHQRTFEVINILTIKNKLSDLGRANAGSECAYFNLLEFNNDKTPCELLAYQEDLKRKTKQEQEAAERQRKEALERLSKAQRQAIQHDKDYPFSVSLYLAGTTNHMAFANSPKDSTGTGWGLGYGAGLLLQWLPDANTVRLVAKPQYTMARFSPPSKYQFASTSGFSLRQVKVSTFEVPVLLEFPIAADAHGDGYFGLGYAFGVQRFTDFAFATKTQGERREAVLGSPRYQHKALVELGGESGPLRIGFTYSYEFSQFLRRDYQFVIESETVSPLRDAGRGYGSIGIEVAYRLWGRWQTGH